MSEEDLYYAGPDQPADWPFVNVSYILVGSESEVLTGVSLASKMCMIVDHFVTDLVEKGLLADYQPE